MSNYSAMDIANWFLAYNKGISESNDITPLKLQKLLYYAYGTYLALTDKELFSDPIMAWEHGPVVPDVYHAFKSYGGNVIDPGSVPSIELHNPEDSEILKAVNDRFGQYSASKLREMTHSETPWSKAPLNSIIPSEAIKAYFEEHHINNNRINTLQNALKGYGLSDAYDSVDDLIGALNA